MKKTQEEGGAQCDELPFEHGPNEARRSTWAYPGTSIRAEGTESAGPEGSVIHPSC